MLQQLKRWKLWLGATLTLFALGLTFSWWQERMGVGYLFDLNTVPWSVSSADCASLGFTDTLVTCAFEIDPSDFPKLLVSEPYTLEETPYYKHAHDHPMSENKGPNFEVAWHYLGKPKDAPNGGSIDVLADKEKRHLLAHLYIE
ncbi:MAG: hypothetical protein QM808_02970 [Steroidobacteraceae bacterium]